MSEILQILKLAWGPDPFTFDGEFFQITEPIEVTPKPATPGGSSWLTRL